MESLPALQPELSIVIPVYNEEASLPLLFARLYPALDALGRSYELIFVNDGSRDRSAGVLRAQFELRPDVTRVVLFTSNFGQHRAILAGFSHSRGRFILTLDADLQNPPEDIGKLVAEFDAGHDYVGTIRTNRQDNAWRRYASRIINRIRERTTRIHMTDQGCMFRGYSRQIVDAINQCSEGNSFIPALGYMFAADPVEIEVSHEERAAGESKYSVYRLIKLNFDLMTSFSILPVQLFSVAGVLVSLVSLAFVVFLLIRRLLIGPEAEGLFTLFAIAFFLIGISLFGLGLLGEYIGRIYEEVRKRPRYLISAILERPEDPH
ncbi:MAG: glycosyltransferase [Gammaproteobacteria bacterium]|nr:glycosyltransferase [Gammaproteobacteria bacterium]MCP5140577.1 glycosyltransferase [Chromatiales bacterium]